MKSNPFIKLAKPILLLCSVSLLNSCSNSSIPTLQSAPTYILPSSRSSFKNSTSSATQVIVKTGSMNLDTSNVREAGEQIEQIVANNNGHILALNEYENKRQNASYTLRIPAENLIQSMDQISELGKVKYRRVTVTDKTKESIAQKARLNKLKQRQKRLQSMYYNAKKLSDKLNIEETLADIEEEIFSMEEAIRELAKFAQYSKLDISLSQKTIRGPVGATLDGASWTWKKLFTIRE